MSWAAAIGAGGAILGGYMSSKGSKDAAATAAQAGKLDPRISQMLFGSADPNSPLSGLLGKYQSMLDTPQSDASKAYGSASSDYLQQYSGQDLGAIRNAATGLMHGNSAPQVAAAHTPAALMGASSASIPSYAVGNMVNAPAQNNIDLTGTLQHLMNPGDNQALKDSLRYGTQLTGAQFDKNMGDLTQNLQRNILPGIQGGAIAAGQYGGTRQGIAQGNALGDFTNQLTSANTQMGLANSANTTGQLGADYQQSQSRALAAAQGLSAQQYAVAQQNANTKNQAEFMNVGNQFDASKYNAGLQQQANAANLGTTAQANLANQNADQTTNLANQSAQLQTNQQNNAGATAGAGMLGGLLGQTSSAAGASDNYALTHAQGVNSLIAPYLSANQTSQQPVYQNTAGNVMGGALMGSQLGGLFGNMFGGKTANTSGTNAGTGMFGGMGSGAGSGLGGAFSNWFGS